jgi:hypothetical protein
MSGPFSSPDAPPTAVMERPATPASRRTLWTIVGAAAAAVVVVGALGAFAYGQYTAPGKTATQFCADLKTQSYSVAYDLLSTTQRHQFTRDQFVQVSDTLDQVEGKVSSCTLAGSSGAYNYSLGSSSATITSVLKRANAGTLQGAVHLKSENGAWKVDALDTSLLGVNLGALETAGVFCAAMQGQAYTTAYSLLGVAAQATVSQTTFVQGAQAHDQIDGTITGCTLVGLGNGNGDSTASLMVTLTRAKLGARTGTVSLDVESGAWKIAALSLELQGTDLGPLQVGAQMCADLVSGNYASIYALTSSAFQANVTSAQVVAFFNLPNGFQYAGCKPDFSTYKVNGNQATYSVEIDLADKTTGQMIGFPFTLYYVDENGGWKLDGIFLKQGADIARAGSGGMSATFPSAHLSSARALQRE